MAATAWEIAQAAAKREQGGELVTERGDEAIRENNPK